MRGADHPDLIVADPIVFGAFWKSLQTIQRITSPEVGQERLPVARVQRAGRFRSGVP